MGFELETVACFFFIRHLHPKRRRGTLYPTKMTSQLAEFLGVYAGDGCMSSSKNGQIIVEIAGSKEEIEWINYVAQLVWKIFGKKVEAHSHSNVYSIQTGDSKICHFLREPARFPVGKKSLIVRVPDIVMNTYSLNTYSAFLRGYFDADGCLNFERRACGKYGAFKRTHHYYPRLLIGSVSKNLITDVGKMLKFIGVRHSIWEKKPSGKGKHRVYCVAAKGTSQLELWVNKIGFSNQTHFTKYLIWKQFGFCPPKTTLNKRLKVLAGELDLEK